MNTYLQRFIFHVRLYREILLEIEKRLLLPKRLRCFTFRPNEHRLAEDVV